MHNFSYNLRHLRLKKKLTQEQVADKLGVSSQSVSRWECGSTFPDVLLLPEIARLYCVTVDDLYREKIGAYANYADRLGSVYEATRDPEDFVRAEKEYKKLFRSGEYTADDLRSYGILHEMMLRHCAQTAMEYYGRVITQYALEAPGTVYRTRVQRMALLAQLGRAQEGLEEQRKKVTEGSGIDEWLLMQSACYHVGDYAGMYDWFQNGLEHFENKTQTPADRLAILYSNGADACWKMERQDEALTLWNRALELDPGLYDARYAMGFCYEQTGNYSKALEIWEDIVRRLERDGYEEELKLPLELAEKCRQRI